MSTPPRLPTEPFSADDINDRLTAILDAVPDAIVVIDAGGRIESFSAAAQRMFGFDPAEVIGRSVNMLMPGPYRDEHDAFIDRFKRTGEARIIGIGRVVSGRRKDGTIFPIELSVSEATFQGNRSFIGFIRDVSERKATERRLEELQTELAHVSRVSEMGQMASTLAHELNQPLTAVLAYLGTALHLLESGDGHEKAQSVVERAASQARRAGSIIHKLRDFLGKGQTTRRPEAINTVVEEASALALIGAKQLQVQSRLELDPAAATVVLDRVQIQQVLVNLIRNAIEAMAHGDRRELVVRTHAAEGRIEVSVSDTGPGIAADVAAKLFQPFVSTKTGGMGIGLSICRSIIQSHGGDIRALPNPAGVGTTFTFTLPTGGPAD
ncbi:MAG: PAS domain S-box protein [Alphaproteobacteria bacterium]|nr:PAS domain S-box protein [Alphaproteobacteria bacterium]